MLPYLSKNPYFQEKKEQFPEWDSLVDAFWQSSLLMNGILNDIADRYSSYGLSTGKFYILMMLHMDPDLKMGPSEIADKINVTRASMTGLIDSLEKEKLVVRVNHPEDRRKIILQITEKGQQVINSILPEHFQWLAEMMKCFSPEERKAFISLLSKMRDKLLDLNKIG